MSETEGATPPPKAVVEPETPELKEPSPEPAPITDEVPEVVDIPLPDAEPPAETTPPIEPEGGEPTRIERFRGMTHGEKIAAFSEVARIEIQSAKTEGIYTDPDKARDAEIAVSRSGDPSQNIRTLLNSLREIKDSSIAADVYQKLAQETRIVFGDEKPVLISELEEKLKTASDEEKARIEEILNNGKYEFTIVVDAENAINETLEREIPTLEAKIKEAQKNKQSSEKEQALLARLRHAREAKGEAGILIRLGALKELRSSGVVGLNDAITLGEATAPSARDLILQRLRDNGQTEGSAQLIIQQIEKGDIAALAKAGYLKETGIDVAVYGRRLDDQEMQKMMNEILNMDTRSLFQKYGKDAGAIFLMLLMMGVNSEQIKKMFGVG